MTVAASATGDTPLVAQIQQAGVRVLTLSNPGARNALSTAMMENLLAAVSDAGSDDQTKVIVLRGKGPAFCAGHDLKEMMAARQEADGGRATFDRIFALCSKLMLAIVRCPKPVIAEIDGIATAAGCQLVASADLAYASSASRFATPGVNIGLFCSTPMVALSRNVSRKHAMEMLLTGDMVSADAAVEIGLINRVFPASSLADDVMDVANKIAGKSPLTIKTGKEAFYAQAEMGLDDAYAYTARVMAENMMARDAGEGISAFLQKRPPDWQGR